MKNLLLATLLMTIPRWVSAQASTATAGEFRFARCPFEVSEPDSLRLRCGFLTVQESRGRPDSRLIDIAVAIWEPVDATSDPVVLLPVAPGGAPLPRWVSRFRNWVPRDRTTIVFDPRGTGLSGPPMCPELNETYSEIAALDLSRTEANGLREGAERGCRNQLLRNGIDLSAYNSVAVASDVVELRHALGYARWNLVSASYGVPFAREIIRQDPVGVRASVLASGSTPDLTKLFAREIPFFYRALQRVFDACERSPECASRFPELEENFFATVESLETDPLTVPVSTELFRQSTFTVNSQDLIRTLYWMLDSETDAVHLPAIMDAFRRRDVTIVRSVVEDIFGRLGSDFSEGMGTSVMCYDAATPTSREEWMRSATGLPVALLKLPFLLDTCSFWSMARASDEARTPAPVAPPALVISGEFDPQNPPEVGAQHLETLENGIHVVIPGLGHMPEARSRDCWASLIRSFLEHPAEGPDRSCISELPPASIRWDLPAWVNRGPK